MSVRHLKRLGPGFALLTAVTAGAAEAPSFFPEPRHALLILGTFHFRDAGADSYKPRFDIDVLAPGRQAEIEQLVRELAEFAPTGVAVEVRPERQAWLDSLYTDYVDGRWTPGSNEIFQIGFRLARAMGHARVHAVDAGRRFYEPWVDPDSVQAALGQQWLTDPAIDAAYERLHAWEDSVKVHRTLSEHLLALNAPDRLLRSHGQYLIGNFASGSGEHHPGVDSKTAWYNRNLRIFANLRRVATKEHERIVLVIGAGHVPILRHAAEASPEFRLVEPRTVISSAGGSGAR